MNKTKSSIFSAWIFDSFDATLESLALYRIFSALFLLLFMLPSPKTYALLSSLPTDFFSPPPGPMMLFHGFPSEWVFLLLHALLILSLLFLLAGFQTKIASLAAGLLLLILKGFIYSLGKINHDMMLVIVLLVMAFSGWGQAYSIDFYRRKRAGMVAQSWTLTLLALILGFMMFTAGFPKILGGWLNIHTHAAQGHFFKQYFVRGRQDLWASSALHIKGAVWEWLDYITVFFEVGFLAAILNSRTTKLFICLAVFFHFCTMMILNIAFLPNFLVYAAFLNWGWINKKSKEYLSWSPAVLVIVCMMVLYGLITWLSHFWVFASGLTMAAVCIISLSLPVALYSMGRQVMLLFAKSHQKEELPSS